MGKWKIGIRGPLAADLPAVCAALEARGYTRLSIRNLARLLAHLSRWLADHQLGAGELTRETIDRFVRDRRAAGYTAHRCASSLEPLSGVFASRRYSSTADAASAHPHTKRRDTGRVPDYLTRERDLAPATARFYLHVAQAVLPGDGDLTRLTAPRSPAAFSTSRTGTASPSPNIG